MMERLFYSIFLTTCLWGITNISDLPQSSSQILGQTSNAAYWVQTIVSRFN